MGPNLASDPIPARYGGGTLPQPFDGVATSFFLGAGQATFSWNIPWQYSVGTVSNQEFTRLLHFATFNGISTPTVGYTVTISKGGVPTTQSLPPAPCRAREGPANRTVSNQEFTGMLQFQREQHSEPFKGWRFNDPDATGRPERDREGRPSADLGGNSGSMRGDEHVWSFFLLAAHDRGSAHCHDRCCRHAQTVTKIDDPFAKELEAINSLAAQRKPNDAVARLDALAKRVAEASIFRP